jgi:hypothetical protein
VQSVVWGKKVVCIFPVYEHSKYRLVFDKEDALRVVHCGVV